MRPICQIKRLRTRRLQTTQLGLDQAELLSDKYGPLERQGRTGKVIRADNVSWGKPEVHPNDILD